MNTDIDWRFQHALDNCEREYIMAERPPTLDEALAAPYNDIRTQEAWVLRQAVLEHRA